MIERKVNRQGEKGRGKRDVKRISEGIGRSVLNVKTKVSYSEAKK